MTLECPITRRGSSGSIGSRRTRGAPELGPDHSKRRMILMPPAKTLTIRAIDEAAARFVTLRGTSLDGFLNKWRRDVEC